MFVKMIFLSVAMILGLSAAIIGAAGVFEGWSLPLLLGGIVIGGGSLLKLVQLNRKYQEDAWQRAIDDPELLYARWTDRDGRDIVFAESGLFIDKKYWAFSEKYSELESITLEDRVLRVTVFVHGGEVRVSKNVNVDVPPESLDAVRRGIKSLLDDYDEDDDEEDED